MELLTAAASEADQRRIAGGLLAHGLEPGDRVAFLTTSSGLMLSGILAALRVGIVPVVLNAGLLEHERDALLADADPNLLVDDAVLAGLAEASPTELAPHPLARPMHYTSGTTGQPKGVWSGVLDEAEARALYEEEADLWGFDAADAHLVCSPFHHSVAIRFGGGTLLAGGSVIILGKFEPHAAVDALRTHEPTSTFMVPAHLQRVFAVTTDVPTTRLRLLAHAGSACPEPLKRQAIEVFGAERVWEFYGSTEGQFSACSSAEWLEHPGTVGRARAHRRLATDHGAIWCEAPTYARFDYWRDPAKTAAAWRSAIPGVPVGVTHDVDDVHRPHGWFTVGDLGHLDDEGYLYIDGRRDDLIITGGVNVYPAEIEHALVAHPGVAECAVFGVPDERWGHRVCVAFVGDAEAGDVLAFARGAMAAYKVPKQAFAVDELPHTSTGKLQRGRLLDVLGFDAPT